MPVSSIYILYFIYRLSFFVTNLDLPFRDNSGEPPFAPTIHGTIQIMAIIVNKGLQPIVQWYGRDNSFNLSARASFLRTWGNNKSGRGLNFPSWGFSPRSQGLRPRCWADNKSSWGRLPRSWGMGFTGWGRVPRR